MLKKLKRLLKTISDNSRILNATEILGERFQTLEDELLIYIY